MNAAAHKRPMAANDDPPWPSVCRFNAAVREIRQRYAAARLKLAADEQRELDEADRKFWNGDWHDQAER